VANVTGLTIGIFLLIGLGALLRRIGLLSFDDRAGLNNIIIFVALPALIFEAAREAPFDPSLLVIAAVALAISLATLGIGYGVARVLKLGGPLMGSFLLASGVGNTGYLGYPLTVALFGQAQLVKAVFFDIFGTVLMLFTAGIYFANKYGRPSDRAWRQGLAYATPNLAGLVLGFALQGVDLPVPVDLAIGSLAQATTGIIMISIGISLRRRFGPARRSIAAIGLLKLAVMPGLALAAAIALGFDPTVGGITVLQASMPIALMTFIIGDKYELDTQFLSGAILLTTLASMATIPVWQTIVSLLTP
jgi:malate permease and related proteins